MPPRKVKASGPTAVVNSLRAAHRSNGVHSYAWRIAQLQALKKMLLENEDALAESCKKDIGKPRQEVIGAEIGMAITDINHAIESLAEWMRPQRVKGDLPFLFSQCEIKPDPLGVVLILGCWNYPVQLTILPLIGAISGGNSALIKPSEISPATADLLADLIPRYLDSEFIRVITGGPDVAIEILKCRFDHILYTGSSRVGKLVMAAAAPHLTPVTLELGGKSPTVVGKCSNLRNAARRITWGRFMNSGQSCIAPDYCMVLRENVDEFIQECEKAVAEFYGDDAQESDSYGRIVSDAHFNRLLSMLNRSKGDIVCGGEYDDTERYIAPTILRNVYFDDSTMEEEIFGPILPILAIDSIDEAIEHINNEEKPLAMYVFDDRQDVVNRLNMETSSGQFMSNDTMMQAGCGALPFGGVGSSGMGGYHGKASFDTYTHKKAVILNGIGMEGSKKVRYPPYNESKINQLKFFSGYPSPKWEMIKTLFSRVIPALGVAFVAIKANAHFNWVKLPLTYLN